MAIEHPPPAPGTTGSSGQQNAADILRQFYDANLKSDFYRRLAGLPLRSIKEGDHGE